MSDVAEALALQGLTTPRVDASDAVDVLVDALLEAALLEGKDAVHAELRERAIAWARRRLHRPPNALELLIDVVDAALAERALPAGAIVGAVRNGVVRLHYPFAVDAFELTTARETVGARLPASLFVEATCWRGAPPGG